MLRRATCAIATCLASLASQPAVAEAPAKPKHALGVVVQGVQSKVARSADLRLVAKVRWSGPKAELRHEWRSVEGPPLPSGADESATELTIPASELDAGDRYHLRLRVVAEWTDEEGEVQSAEAQSDVLFEVNAPPRDGKCTLDLRWSGPVQASLTLGAPGWKDDDQVQYRYSLLRDDKEVVVRNWSLAKSVQTVSVARAGSKLQAKCMVRDKFGDGVTELSDPVTRPGS
jgi:hypothetical protein